MFFPVITVSFACMCRTSASVVLAIISSQFSKKAVQVGEGVLNLKLGLFPCSNFIAVGWFSVGDPLSPRQYLVPSSGP